MGIGAWAVENCQRKQPSCPCSTTVGFAQWASEQCTTGVKSLLKFLQRPRQGVGLISNLSLTAASISTFALDTGFLNNGLRMV